MPKLPAAVQTEILAALRTRDLDRVFATLARLILSERLQVSEAALGELVGAVGLARRTGMDEPPPPAFN